MELEYQKMFDFGSKTDKGRVKEKNEDNMGFFETPNGYIAVLCDGMGGHSAGALASDIAVSCIREYFESNTYEDVCKALEDSMKYANSQVFDEAGENTDYYGMGTTCVIVLVKNDLVYYASVGDSRIYTHSNKELKSLTKDHTYIQQLIDKGELSVEEAQSHPRKNELLRAIGVSNDVDVDVCQEPIKVSNGDSILICSDGLTNMVNEITIEYSLRKNSSAEGKANHLTELAIKEGGYDNISVQVLDFNSIPSEDGGISLQKNKFSNLLIKNIPLFRKYPKAIYGVYLLIALIFVWAVYDMFFKGAKAPVYQSNQEEILSPDSNSSAINDTMGAEENGGSSSGDHTPTNGNQIDNSAVYLTYTVRKGDALSLLSQRFNLKVNKLMEVNNLSNAGIRVGQQIKIPLKAIYTIKAGDNLYDIAKKYGVTRKLLRKANRLKKDTDIYIGSNLYVPFP